MSRPDIGIYPEDALAVRTALGAAATVHTHDTATTGAAGFMSTTMVVKLDGIAENANNYVHPTSDGNLHVPVTGTTNEGAVLVAGATAGSFSWSFQISFSGDDMTSTLNNSGLALSDAAYDSAFVASSLSVVETGSSSSILEAYNLQIVNTFGESNLGSVSLTIEDALSGGLGTYGHSQWSFTEGSTDRIEMPTSTTWNDNIFGRSYQLSLPVLTEISAFISYPAIGEGGYTDMEILTRDRNTLKTTIIFADESAAGLRLTPGTDPDTGNLENGDIWPTTTDLKIRLNGLTETFAFTSDLTGGTVTSVGLSLPGIFSVSNSPVTSSGTLTATLASQTANFVWASPNGSAGAPTFRALVGDDIPNLDASKITTGILSKSVTDFTLTIITEAGTTLTLDATNAGADKIIRLTSGSSIAITVAASLAAGLVWNLRQAGVGVGTVAVSGGGTVNGDASTAGQHTSMTVIHVGSNTVDVEGGMS